MDLKDIVAVSGKEGLFRVHGRRDDGMICESLLDGKRGFIPSRQHMFSPLEGITIYTTASGDEETIELKKVFETMLNQEASQPIPDGKADGAALRTYFKAIVPNHDEEKVYSSDIKKVVKWYALLKSKGLMVFTADEEKKEDAAAEGEVKEAKPKATKAKKEGADKKPKADAKTAKTAAPSRAKAPVKKVTTPRKAS